MSERARFWSGYSLRRCEKFCEKRALGNSRVRQRTSHERRLQAIAELPRELALAVVELLNLKAPAEALTFALHDEKIHACTEGAQVDLKK